MKTRKLLALMLALLLTMGLLAGCGGASMDSAADAPAAEAPMENGAYYDDVVVDTETSLSESADSAQAAMPENMKIITTIHMDAETEDLDGLLASINAKITALGGYMEAQEIHNGSAYSSYRYRYAYLTIRIPAENLSQFTDQVAEEANVVNSNTTTENVTLSYVAIQSRITALETEEARLLELLAKAENMEDLLLIESRLTEVRTELERVSSQLRVMDNKINYSTIYLNLQEVREYTEVEEPETFWERISDGFGNSLEKLGDGLVEFIIFFITSLPYFVFLGVIALVVILIIKKTKKKKKDKKEPPKPQEQKPE